MILAAGSAVLMGELSDAPEGQEGLEAQGGCRVGVDEGVAQQDSVFIVLEHHFFPQQHASHPIQGCGHLVAVKLPDVLVSFGAEVVALVLVQSEVELRSMLNHGDIERREQHMVLVVQFGYWHDQQAMILASVAVYNG